MIREAKFVPLDQLESFFDTALVIKINLPEYVPRDQIGINIMRIKFLSRMAGLRHLRIDTASGETSSEQFVPNSIDGQGNATASLTLSNARAPLFKTDLERDKSLISRIYSEFSWSDERIIINSSELNKRTEDAARKENGPRLREPDEWANLLDKSITAGLSKVARENLLKNVSFMSKYWLGVTMFSSIFGSGWLYGNPKLQDSLISFLYDFSGCSIVNQFIATGLTAVQFRDKNVIKERRLSIIPAYQLDRLFLVNSIAKSSKLVKVIKPDKLEVIPQPLS